MVEHLILASSFNRWAGPNNPLLDLCNHIYQNLHVDLMLVTHKSIFDPSFLTNIKFPIAPVMVGAAPNLATRLTSAPTNVKIIDALVKNSKIPSKRIFVNASIDTLFEAYMTTRARLVTGYNVLYNNPSSPLFRLMDRVAARYVIEKIVAHTQFMKSLYLQAGIRENKVTVIPHCVDLHRIKSAISQRVSRTLVPPSERQTIFYAGKFNIMKGVKELVECYKGICEIQGTRLVLMGKGPLEKWLLQQKQEIEHRSATAQILLLPWQQHPVMLSCMAEANIVVCPSLVEPFGIFMLEAMSLGKPVIATHFGGHSEIICDHVNGLLIDPRNHRQFKAALLELLTDENIRTRTSLNALETVQSKYEVSKVATRFLRFLGDEE